MIGEMFSYVMPGASRSAAGDSYDRAMAQAMLAKEAHLFHKAERYYRAAISLKPRQSLPHTQLGWVYTQEKKLAQAKREEETAIKLNNGDADAYYNLAGILFMEHKYALAAVEYRKSLAIDPDRHCKCGPLYSLLKKYPNATPSSDTSNK